jgi:hypothetical protein
MGYYVAMTFPANESVPIKMRDEFRLMLNNAFMADVESKEAGNALVIKQLARSPDNMFFDVYKNVILFPSAHVYKGEGIHIRIGERAELLDMDEALCLLGVAPPKEIFS